MVFTDEERKARKKITDAKSYQKNKEKRQAQNRIYNELNKEKMAIAKQKWAENNRQKCRDAVKKCRAKCMKTTFKAKWKFRGVIWKDDDEFNSIWERYKNTTNCDNCNVEFKIEPTKMLIKCLDHCHDSGKFRQILCGHCNINVVR
tara:strand:- start:294 stop:731 length:438 start_codon:yes stop_codon:yes gene_type:complete